MSRVIVFWWSGELKKSAVWNGLNQIKAEAGYLDLFMEVYQILLFI
jgi:hypothetical protein